MKRKVKRIAQKDSRFKLLYNHLHKEIKIKLIQEKQIAGQKITAELNEK